MQSKLLLLALFLSIVTFAQEIKTDSIKKINNLNEVKVFGNKKEFIKVESDKTTVNIKDNSMLNSGSSFDAVKKLPGIITSPTGSLTLNGKGVAIYIDGAPSTLSGNDLQNYLSSLPASAIEKVELIYNPGAAFDANSSGSVINIVTSTRRLKGVNASFNLNYSFNKYQKPSPQILLNGKEKNLSWQTMAGYNYIDSEKLSRNSQTFTTFSPVETLNQQRLTITTNRNFYFRVGTNYRLTQKSNLLFNYNLNLGNDRDVFDAKTLGSGVQSGGINYVSNGITKNKISNHEVSLQFKTKLDTIGRTLDIVAFTNLFNKNPINKSNAFDNGNQILNNGNSDFGLTNYYLKYDFTIPFGKMKFTINTGGKYNSIQVKNDGIYNVGISNSAINFDYKEHNLAFYAEAKKKIKKFNFTLGLRFENFDIDRKAVNNSKPTNVKYSNQNIFPNISALYEVNNNINVSASYSRKISQPNYNALDPNNSSSFDQYNNSQGNPFLKSVFYDNYDLKLTAFQFVQLGTNMTVAKDENLFLFNANPGELVSNQTFQQFDKFKTLSVYASFPIPLDYFLKGKEEFQKRMNDMDNMNYVFLNLNYIKSTTEGYKFNFENKPVWNYAAQSQIILPWKIKNSMTYYILPSGTWQIYKITKPIQQFDMSFNRDFLDKKLKVGMHVFDVFNSNQINALLSSTNLQTNFYQKNDSRSFRISLTYNFGNLKLEKENTDIQTEKAKQGGGIMK